MNHIETEEERDENERNGRIADEARRRFWARRREMLEGMYAREHYSRRDAQDAADRVSRL